MLRVVINMFKWLGQKISDPFVKTVLKNIAEVFIAFLVTKTVSEVTKYVGKFLPIGGTIFGRQYALTLTLSDQPPQGHPKAVHVGVVSNKDWGIEFHLWVVSFPKDKWEKIPELQKIHLKW